MENKANKFSKRFLKQPLFKKFSKKTWKDGLNVSNIFFIFIYLIKDFI